MNIFNRKLKRKILDLHVSNITLSEALRILVEEPDSSEAKEISIYFKNAFTVEAQLFKGDGTKEEPTGIIKNVEK